MLHVSASRRRLRPVWLPLLAVIGILAAGCGDSSNDGKLLSRRQASELRASLTQVQEEVSARNCTGATEQVAELESQIDSIKRLNRDLRSSLRASVRRLDTLVSDACETTTTTTTPTETTPATGDTGASGASGATGEGGKEGKKEKNEKPGKKEKPPKNEDATPPGDGQTSPGNTGGAGGAGVPGE
jgi:hypothetical protein